MDVRLPGDKFDEQCYGVRADGRTEAMTSLGFNQVEEAPVMVCFTFEPKVFIGATGI